MCVLCRFLNDVDCICISDNYWLGTKKPCITYGLRGICYFFLAVRTSNLFDTSLSLSVSVCMPHPPFFPA